MIYQRAICSWKHMLMYKQKYFWYQTCIISRNRWLKRKKKKRKAEEIFKMYQLRDELWNSIRGKHFSQRRMQTVIQNERKLLVDNLQLMLRQKSAERAKILKTDVGFKPILLKTEYSIKILIFKGKRTYFCKSNMTFLLRMWQFISVHIFREPVFYRNTIQ